MPTLVVGATGATGRLLVQKLLMAGQPVRAVVRAVDRLPTELREHPDLELIEGAILDLPPDELARHVGGCDSIASCLGHTLSFRGVFGPPHRLVTEAVRRLCTAAADQPTRLVLMNTTGNRNRDLDEPLGLAHRAMIGVLRALVPPHADNEQAADYLRTRIGQDHPTLQWVAVRPDTLVDAEQVTGYTLHPSPTRSALFDPGKTSRINVANLMMRLITEPELWAEWQGRMPVIYNDEG